MNNEKVYAMSFAKIYPLLTAKAEKKGRTLDEVNEVICWLTGYSTEEIEKALNSPAIYGDFFQDINDLFRRRRCNRRLYGNRGL